MARPLRILYPNAWYHVMNRGGAHALIFHDSDDYQYFLDLLLQTNHRFRFEIHAYCLMPNHYHILVRTPLANLDRGMQRLDGLYTQYYNKKYHRDGSLFRGRYKSILVDAKNYLLRISRYIHLNPVRANLVKHPRNYNWSSYTFYSTSAAVPDWFYTKEVLSCFGTTQQKNKYALFVLEKTDIELETFYCKVRLLPILGSDPFYKQMVEKYLKKNIRKIPP
jgi:putative transposase